MNELIVVSLCEKYINKRSLIGYQFHFRGIFMSKSINKINVQTEEILKLGEEYLLHLKIVEIKNGGLEACLISSIVFKRLYF